MNPTETNAYDDAGIFSQTFRDHDKISYILIE